MKPFLITIFVFTVLNANGQVNFNPSGKTMDSLFERLKNLAMSTRKYDTTTIRYNVSYLYETKNHNDSSVIIFFDSLGSVLFKKINRYDKTGCRWWEVDEIYNYSGKLVYWEAVKWSCLRPEEKTDPEVKYFDGLLYEQERLFYDISGRLKKRIWLYVPLNGVRNYTYSYDQNNTQTYQMTRHDYNSFWNL